MLLPSQQKEVLVMSDRLLTIDEAAKIAEVTRSEIEQWIFGGQLRYYEIPAGRSTVIRIRLSDLLNFERKRARAPTPRRQGRGG
jgi:excisionase family DNA binding protein